jgi:hypothetical protein
MGGLAGIRFASSERMANDRETTTNTGAPPESPGDNRGAGDLDGNRTSKGGKAPGPNEPPQAPSKKA